MAPADWISRYARAWETGDDDTVADLFTADAVYRSQIFREPHVGTEEIRAYWRRGAGTQSDLEILYRDRNTHLVYAEGIYNGPVLKRPVKGRCVVLLQSGYSQQEDGAEFVTHRIDAFIHLDRVGAELVAKTFQPLVGKSADENFSEATAFLTRLSQAAEQNQAGVQVAR